MKRFLDDSRDFFKTENDFILLQMEQLQEELVEEELAGQLVEHDEPVLASSSREGRAQWIPKRCKLKQEARQDCVASG